MTQPLFVDISSWQPTNIDWPLYIKWASSFDGHTSIVSLRSSQGVGLFDKNYKGYKSGFLSNGGKVIFHYHYAYPQLNSAVNEANYQFSIIGDLKVRPQDIIMLDLEEQVPQATAEWAYQWGIRARALYNRKPNLYASDSYVRNRLQDSRLPEVFTLTLAKWQFTPNERPACPPPWKEYLAVQYTDRATVPGIGGLVDADIYFGAGVPSVPTQPPEFSAEDISIWQLEDKLIPFNTGIARNWLARRKEGKEMGPPIDHEYGDRLTAHQVFTGASASWEHTTHVCTWRDSRGKI
jgi:GH25 family lysozyme M1 (1,4-beta-N-acetylmuramidase)